ncbi:MAG: T9SS type A sorting domain-containing protein [Saprospiraceae bacterium]
MKYLSMSFVFLFLLMMHKVNAQKDGDAWVIGYSGNAGNPDNSIMYLYFTGDRMQIELQHEDVLYITGTSANICDRQGVPVVWTNGMQIFGKHGIKIADTIAYDGNQFGYWNYFYNNPEPLGFPLQDGAIILPVPEHEGEFSVLYHSMSPHPTIGFKVDKHLEARVRMNFDTSYILEFRDSLMGPILKWYKGTIIATRHANGRDWWILTFEADSPRYFSFLLDPTGTKLVHEGNVGHIVEDGLGQAVFSGNGNFMARMDATTFEEGQFISLFHFDRCTGYLEDIGTFHTEAGYFTGVAFSPSEQYLYADDNTHIWQWDLWAEDIAASQTLVDTFDMFVQPGWFGTFFGPMMTAPDGRIYIVPPSGSSNFMHVIERPDLPASECFLNQHSINLQVSNGRSAPNIPNYRLGPIDGSPCDTLGLNNNPVAKWRYEEKVAGYPHEILFTDLSFFNPTTWHWDFDDGSTSAERSPVHTFESGLYHVCLTVNNENASESLCRWIEILETGTQDGSVNTGPDLSIAPNPFHDKLIIHSASGTFRSAHVQLYDMYGRNVFDQAESPIPVSLVMPSLSPGMYLCLINDQDGTMYSFKVMKQ